MQFRGATLVAEVAEVVRESGLPPEQLRLEITESALLDGSHATTERLVQLRALGIQLQVDDFGTGYSSLAYLQQLPLDSVKLDKAFVQAAGEESQAIVRTIVSLAHTLGLDVVAEGIETDVQLRRLRMLNCRWGQGFLFAKPLDAEAAEALLDADPTW